MPLFQVDIQKTHPASSRFWTNRYIVNAATLQAAASVAQQIRSVEAQVLLDAFGIDKIRTSDMVEGTDQFIIDDTLIVGNRPTTGEWLPLFCVARVDFSAGSGRPSRKYLRGVLLEADQANGALTAAARTFINDNYSSDMLAIPEFVDVDGEAFITAGVNQNVGQRQLRRGSRRSTTPIL